MTMFMTVLESVFWTWHQSTTCWSKNSVYKLQYLE